MTDNLRARRYVIGMGVVVVVLLGSVAMMNIVMDPLGYARASGWRPIRPSAIDVAFAAGGAWPVPHGTREAKILNVAIYKPTTVYFGSSTVWSYIDTGYPPLLWSDGRKGYNFGLAGATARELLASFEHTVALTPPRRVVVGLEFYMFSADKLSSPGFDELPFAHRPSYRRDFWRFIGRHVLSSDYTSESATQLWQAIVKTTSAWLSPAVAAAERVEDGAAAPMTKPEFAKVMFDVDKILVSALYPAADKPFRFVDDSGFSSLEAVRRMVVLARIHDIDLRFYLSPNHARSFEMIRLLGWWPEFEAWQRGLTSILAADAKAHTGQSPIPLWDFCCYNAVTTDAVSQLPGEAAGFKHFADPIHFKTHVGFMLMDRIFDSEAARALPADFGVLITAGNIEAHLAAIARAQRDYQITHAEDVKAVEGALETMGRLKRVRQ